MKILICTLNYAPEPTATGKYTGELAEWLAKRGHQVEVISAYPHYPQWKVFEGYRGRRLMAEVKDGVRVMRVPCLIPNASSVSGLTRIGMELSFTLVSTAYWVPILFKRSKFDVVLAICPPMQTAIYPIIYNLFRGVPWIFHIQDFQVDMALRLGILRTNSLTRLLYKIESFLLRRSSYVSTITDPMKQRALEKGVRPDRAILFPNWSNNDQVSPGERTNKMRKELGYAVSDFIVLYSGGMGEKQGLEIILDAAALTIGQQAIKYLIVGDGGAKERLVEQSRSRDLNNIRFLPLQPLERLSDLLAISDVNLVVQRLEAGDFVMPSKVTNILAAGRPMIATVVDDTELGRLIHGHSIGRLVSPGDAEELVGRIQELYKDGSLSGAMGVAARRYAEAHLDKNQILSQFEYKLSRIVNRGLS